MANNADIIREFLVSLGWKIDEGGQRRFANTIALQTVKVQELARGLEETASKVIEFVSHVADGLEKLYFASLRTKASAENIQSLGFAAGQMGSTAEAAQGSLENLARFLRTNPGGEGLLGSLGVQTQQTNGELRDTSAILHDLGKRLAQMPYYRANAYAQTFGIDERTLLALREGLGEFGSEYTALLRSVGLDSQSAAKASHDFMNGLRGVRATVEVLAMRVASNALPALTGFAVRLRQNLINNLPWISDVLSRVLKGTMSLIGIVGQLGGRAMEIVGGIIAWWSRLDTSSKTLIGTIGGLLAAWKLLNLGFLLSPVGMIAALGAAIIALYDDYRVWQEGGKSFINWSEWEPGLEKAKGAIDNLVEALGQLAKALHFDFKLKLELFSKDDLANITDTLNALAAITRRDWAAAGNLLNRGLLSAAQRAAHSVDRYGNPSGAAPQLQPVPSQANSFPAGTPRGIRNNNPGNIEFHGQAGALKEAGPTGRFAVFETVEQGLAALANQLRSYARRGIDSVQGIISKFAPPNENNTVAYIQSVAKALGVAANEKLDLGNSQLLAGLMKSIIKVENGRVPYTAEQLSAAAALGGAPPTGNPYAGEMLASPVSQTSDQSKQVTIHQTNTTTVTGAADPQRTAKAVGDAQVNANQLLIRNTRAVAY